MAERLGSSIVYEVLDAEKPGTIQQLVKRIGKRINATQNEIVSLLRVMAKSGELKLKQDVCASKASSYQDNIDSGSRPALRHTRGLIFRFFNYMIIPFRNETITKALSLILIFNVISWVIIFFFQTSLILAPFRIIFNGVNLFFLPGFAMTIAWYPFSSAQLDFTRLEHKAKARDGRIVEDRRRDRELDLLTRVAYSICYSIGLVILVGFLIGLLGLGFNIMVMHGIFTIIELLVISVVIVKVQKIRDPYLNL